MWCAVVASVYATDHAPVGTLLLSAHAIMALFTHQVDVISRLIYTEGKWYVW